jgi:hypothetical protein
VSSRYRLSRRLDVAQHRRHPNAPTLDVDFYLPQQLGARNVVHDTDRSGTRNVYSCTPRRRNRPSDVANGSYRADAATLRARSRDPLREHRRPEGASARVRPG